MKVWSSKPQEIIERASVCFNYNWPETEVVVAESGSEATKLLDHHRSDMVVLGMGTAGMNPLHCCWALDAIRSTLALTQPLMPRPRYEIDPLPNALCGWGYFSGNACPHGPIVHYETLVVQHPSNEG